MASTRDTRGYDKVGDTWTALVSTDRRWWQFWKPRRVKQTMVVVSADGSFSWSEPVQ